LLRQVRRRAPKSHRIAHLFVCPGISEITPESFHHKTRAHSATGRQRGRIRRSPISNFLAWPQFYQRSSRRRELHRKPFKSPACRLFTRAWVSDPHQARHRALWHRHAAARLRARRQSACRRSITPTSARCDGAAIGSVAFSAIVQVGANRATKANRPPLLLRPVIRCRIRPAQCSEPGKG
jgi:hypothetical protein